MLIFCLTPSALVLLSISGSLVPGFFYLFAGGSKLNKTGAQDRMRKQPLISATQRSHAGRNGFMSYVMTCTTVPLSL